MGKKLSILHLATWYPTSVAPFSVPFIKAHYNSLEKFVDQRLIHVEISRGGAPRFECRFETGDGSRIILHGFRGPTRIQELLTLLCLVVTSARLFFFKCDVIVIHVAWPTFRFPRLVKALFGSKVLVIEHWSAYAEDFYLDPRTKAHARMRRMFSGSTPIIAVSKRLAFDIANFAQRDDLNIRVVPNVVDGSFRYSRERIPNSIFLAANWNSFRLPFLILNVVPDLLARHPDLQFIIAGGGPNLQRIVDFVSSKGLEKSVRILGAVSREQIAQEMNRAAIFAHPTSYETFSVITAEALSCGVPVVVSNVGALPELVTPGVNGILVENDEVSWRDALLHALVSDEAWDRERIASDAQARFSPDVVGRQLARILTEVAGQ